VRQRAEPALDYLERQRVLLVDVAGAGAAGRQEGDLAFLATYPDDPALN
jgi:hypothetical protein